MRRAAGSGRTPPPLAEARTFPKNLGEVGRAGWLRMRRPEADRIGIGRIERIESGRVTMELRPVGQRSLADRRLPARGTGSVFFRRGMIRGAGAGCLPGHTPPDRDR